MAQIFPRWTNSIPTVGVSLVALLGASTIFVVWYWFSPQHTDVGYTPKQPIPYSHKLHAGEMQMDCRYCHYNVERSAHAGVPPTQVCMNCHSQIRKDSPLLEALRTSWADGKDGGPVPWKRIHKVPDFAYFNHSVHVQVGSGENRAAIGCESCHGRIDLMEVVGQVQPLSMAWCLDCHDNPARFLRPVDDVTKMGWSAPLDWPDRAAAIAQTLQPPGRRSAVYTENPDGTHTTRATYGCNGCHR